MTTAILEILALLIISCLIGVFFTYRFWRSKHQLLQKQSDERSSKINQLERENSERRTKMDRLTSEMKSLQLDVETAKKSTKPKSKNTSNEKEVIRSLKNQLELQEESLQEKERELEELSKELAAKKISYYKQIDGKRYKAITLIKADEAVAGKGDGRISKADAEIIFATISDGKSYTQVEKDTLRYLRDNYNWTEGADELFRTKVRSWAAKGHELDK